MSSTCAPAVTERLLSGGPMIKGGAQACGHEREYFGQGPHPPRCLRICVPFDARGVYASTPPWSARGGFSWIALRMQLGVVAPEVSLLWRFMIAGAVMWGWVLITRQRIAFPGRLHAGFRRGGRDHVLVQLRSCITMAVLTIPSGLLAVAFSLAAVGNPLMAAAVPAPADRAARSAWRGDWRDRRRLSLTGQK